MKFLLAIAVVLSPLATFVHADVGGIRALKPKLLDIDVELCFDSRDDCTFFGNVCRYYAEHRVYCYILCIHNLSELKQLQCRI